MAEQKRSKTVSVYMDENLAAELDKVQKATGKTRGKVIIDALEPVLKEVDKASKRPMVITITSFKGGVAKTTTAANLGLCLGANGAKVLIIDLDGQGSISQYLGVYDPEAVEPCIADVMLSDKKGNRSSLLEVMKHTDYENVDIVPSSFRFSGADSKMKQETGVGIDTRLKYAIDDLVEEADYDYIIIDCPPSLELVVTNAITALEAGNPNSFVIIPIRPDGFSIAGMRDTINMIETVARERRITPRKYYLLWTIIEPKTNVFKVSQEVVSNEFRNVEFLRTRIHKATAAAEASLAGMPLCAYDSNAKPAQQYEDLAIEVEELNQL